MPTTATVQLQQMIASLEAFKTMADEVAPVIAKAVEGEQRKSIAAGTDPYGLKWLLTKDGRVPLRNAMQAVRVVPVGKVVYIHISGIEARHHLGAVKGKIRRRIIPSKKLLPPRMADAIKRELDEWFQLHVKEGKANG